METHISVLTDELVTGLQLSPGATVVDCTLGSGGHARRIIDQLHGTGTYIGVDVDPAAIAYQAASIGAAPNVELVTDNFRNIAAIVTQSGHTQVDAILADLGWRTEQFVTGGKGFSFNTDEPLAMTFGDPEAYTFTAYDIANEWEEPSIADIVYGYGEERFARRIAKAIVAARVDAPITTSGQLAAIVENAVPKAARHRKIHPATKTFQAFRIAVNDELGALTQLLTDGIPLLRSGGRMAVITFHSLEDRIVKRHFVEQTRNQVTMRITKKPITASDEELATNPRARSAKLRIIEKM